MKDIILPSETADAIDLGAINNNTNGIIIIYLKKEAVGYIFTMSGEWYFTNSIDIDASCPLSSQEVDRTKNSLPELVRFLIKKYKADSFKLIDFKITPSFTDIDDLLDSNTLL